MNQKRVPRYTKVKKNSGTSGGSRNNQTRGSVTANGINKAAVARRKRQRLRKRRIQKAKQGAVMLCFLFVVIGMAYLIISGICSLFVDKPHKLSKSQLSKTVELDGDIHQMMVDSPPIDVDLLTVNKYSRPGIKLEQVNGIVIHYVGNPGTSAAQNRSYFESLKDSHATKASSHFIVGLEGEIVQCIPTSEVAYCSNDRNDDTIAIEVCHETASGKFNEDTYDSLVHLTAFMCCKNNIEMDDIIRHYDVTGKECPKYYVKHEDKWVQFKKDVAAYIEKHAYEK